MNEFRRHEASEHFERGIILEQAGRVDEAIVEYRRAVDADPGFSEAYEALGYHYQHRRLLRKAMEAFQAVARLEGNYSAYFNLGYVLNELERYEEALEAFHHCLTLVPEDPAALYESGYAYYALGRPNKALQMLRHPRRAYANDWRLHSLIGACYLSMKHWKRAEKSYRRAIKEAPSPNQTHEVRAGLRIAQRYQEFPSPRPLTLKDQFYTDAGAILLGTDQDDGLQIEPWADPIVSTTAMATTMRRLYHMIRALGREPTAIVAVDRASIPLAIALGQMLHLPRRRLFHLEENQRPLLVLAIGRQAELLQVALEQAPPGAISFVMVLAWYGEQFLLPDLTGVPGPKECSLPWKEAIRDQSEIQAAVRELLIALQSLDPEEEAEQIRYYTEEHRQLDFMPGGSVADSVDRP